MTDQDQRPNRTEVSSDVIERYADPDRPPAPWMFPVTGVAAGAAVALVWILPGLWGLGVVLLVGAAGLGVDGWLARHYGLPRLYQLPPEVRRGQVVLAVGVPVAVLVPLLLAGALAWVSTEVGAVVAGVAVAVLVGVGGPITDRRARANARELLR